MPKDTRPDSDVVYFLPLRLMSYACLLLSYVSFLVFVVRVIWETSPGALILGVGAPLGFVLFLVVFHQYPLLVRLIVFGLLVSTLFI